MYRSIEISCADRERLQLHYIIAHGFPVQLFGNHSKTIYQSEPQHSYPTKFFMSNSDLLFNIPHNPSATPSIRIVTLVPVHTIPKVSHQTHASEGKREKLTMTSVPQSEGA
jgi:hypothetical protein